MRLFSHNLLMCPQQNCKEKGFPLAINVSHATYKQSSYKKEKLLKVAKKMHWNGLRKAVHDLGDYNFPQNLEKIIGNEEALKKLHRYIYDTHIEEGSLTCPHCGKIYEIKKGLPNMNEEKVEGKEEEKEEDYQIEYTSRDSDDEFE